MERVAPTEEAFGKPGIEPRWKRGNKDAVGTAYSASSRVWFTLAAGILNEMYFPATDRFLGENNLAITGIEYSATIAPAADSKMGR